MGEQNVMQTYTEYKTYPTKATAAPRGIFPATVRTDYPSLHLW
ncbi:MAG: hypothetical protein RR619_04910 [Raoultibacter sp.]